MSWFSNVRSTPFVGHFRFDHLLVSWFKEIRSTPLCWNAQCPFANTWESPQQDIKWKQLQLDIHSATKRSLSGSRAIPQGEAPATNPIGSHELLTLPTPPGKANVLSQSPLYSNCLISSYEKSSPTSVRLLYHICCIRQLCFCVFEAYLHYSMRCTHKTI